MRKFALGATTLGIPLFLKLFPPRDDIRLPIPSANNRPSVDPTSIQLDCSVIVCTLEF